MVCILRLIVLPSCEDRTTRYLAYITLDKVKSVKMSFSTDDGDGENVTIKMNSRFFKLFRVYSSSLEMSNMGEFPWSWFLVACVQTITKLWLVQSLILSARRLISWGPHSSLEREGKIRRRFFTSSIKREIGHFHVVVCCDDGEMY